MLSFLCFTFSFVFSTVAGHRHPPHRRSYSGVGGGAYNPAFVRPLGFRKAQHNCTTVSIAYTPLQHTVTVAPATVLTVYFSLSVHNISAASVLAVFATDPRWCDHDLVCHRPGALEQVLSHGSETE